MVILPRSRHASFASLLFAPQTSGLGGLPTEAGEIVIGGSLSSAERCQSLPFQCTRRCRTGRKQGADVAGQGHVSRVPGFLPAPGMIPLRCPWRTFRGKREVESGQVSVQLPNQDLRSTARQVWPVHKAHYAQCRMHKCVRCASSASHFPVPQKNIVFFLHRHSAMCLVLGGQHAPLQVNRSPGSEYNRESKLEMIATQLRQLSKAPSGSSMRIMILP